MPSTVNVVRIAALYYPVIITELTGNISESKAAELLARNIEEYRELKSQITQSVMTMIGSLPSPLILLLEDLKAKQGGSTEKR